MSTKTSSFGTSKREGHDASGFYARNMYGNGLPKLEVACPLECRQGRIILSASLEEWVDKIYCQSSEDMAQVPNNSVGLAFTSPPYNAGKDFDDDLDLPRYFNLIKKVADEVYRTLVPGGRYVVNIANLGRKPYVPLHAFFYSLHMASGFLPAGEVIWRKSKGMSGNCAWGSWRSARAPRLRDLHEYLLVFAKERFERPDRGDSGISAEEFMAATLSVWDINAASAKKVGHPAPFPIELAERVVRLLSYQGDTVLDPFNGSGTTCVAAVQCGRHYVGYDISEPYCELARKRVDSLRSVPPGPPPAEHRPARPEYRHDEERQVEPLD